MIYDLLLFILYLCVFEFKLIVGNRFITNAKSSEPFVRFFNKFYNYYAFIGLKKGLKNERPTKAGLSVQ